MSIAYGFEPDVSPIYEDDDDNHAESGHSVHFSSADTPRRKGRPSSSRQQRTLGTSQLFNDSSYHNFHQECAPSVVESTLDFLEPSDEVVPDSREEDVEEVVPDSTGFLSDTFIVLSAGCCLPIRQHLSKCLVEMGATVQKRVDHRTTHVVVDRYADELIVGEAMKRRPGPPLMVDVKWIQECVDRREKCEETDYSMRDCRYLKQTCRRLSSFREPTPFSHEQDEDVSIEWADMEDDGPQDPAVLLEQIKKLSERLDALLDYVPIIRFEYHSPDCPTRQRPIQRPEPTNFPTISNKNPLRNIEKIRQLLLSTSSPIRRRRSFTGYCLEHREPENPVLEVQLASKDVRETWKLSGKSKKPKKTAKKPRKNTKNTKNSEIPPKKRPKPVPVRADDSDIQSALASLTISSPQRLLNSRIPDIPMTSSNSVEILEIRRTAPLVVTKSAFINRLQCREDSRDDDFISDVSAFRQTKNRRNETGNWREKEKEEEEKLNVVFTGFGKDSSIEKKLKSILRRFKLQFTTEIDEKTTRCVVSRHGKRTLLVLKAVCLDIPVVRPQWLEESFEDSQLLLHNDYIFPEWQLIPGQNRQEIFKNYPKFWISIDCSPSRDDLCWMIEKCGGSITRKIASADVIIAPENWKNSVEIPEETPICTPLFVIDSISEAEIQPTEDYLI